MGISYRHDAAAMSYEKLDLENFVDDYYPRDTYRLCYNFNASLIDRIDVWPNVDVNDMLPLTFKKGPYRPRKLRYGEYDEVGSKTRRSDVGYRCTKCDKLDHKLRIPKQRTRT